MILPIKCNTDLNLSQNDSHTVLYIIDIPGSLISYKFLNVNSECIRESQAVESGRRNELF